MTKKVDIQEELRRSVRRIMQDKELSQNFIADIANTDSGQMSKILSGKGRFTLQHVENLANYFGFRTIDMFTYPDQYVPKEKDRKREDAPDVVVSLRLNGEKKEQVMRLVFGEHDIEILNK